MKAVSVRLFGRILFVTCVNVFLPSQAGAGGGTVVLWGGDNVGQLSPCAGNVVAVSAGYEHSLLLTASGTVADCGMFWAPGSNPTNYDFPITVPSGLANVVAVSGGYSHSLALKADGTVVAWGIDTDGQMDVPAGLRNVVAIAAGAAHSLALEANGTLVGWGGASTNVPLGLSNVVAIAAGAGSSLVLKADGTVVGWGFSRDLTNGLSGLTNVVAVSAGWNEWLALKADGTVVGQSWYAAPSGLTNIVSICASSGNDHHISLAIKADGTVAGWGFNFFSGPRVPPGLSNVVAVASDSSHSLALVGGGSPFLRNRLISRTAVMSGNTYFRIEASGAWPLSYQWQLNGADLPGATGPVLVLTNLQPGQAGIYSVKVSNALGTVTSAGALLTLIPLQINAQPKDQAAFIGGTAAFEVGVQGGTPLSYQWQWNGLPLEGATNSAIMMTNVQVDQAGSYSVIISNAFSTIASSNAYLTVAPAVITTSPQHQIAHLGGTARFNAVAQGIGPLGYQWQFNGTDLPGATSNSLTLPNLQIDQAGHYSVMVRNTFGSVNSADAILSVVVVAAWGNNTDGQANVPADLTNVIAIGAGYYHSLALIADGTVVAWGDNSVGQTNEPVGLANVVAVASASSSEQSLALRIDGTVVSWGGVYFPPPPVPQGLTNVVAVAVGAWHNLALKAEGTVVGWGDNTLGQATAPADLTNAVAIAAGEAHSLALKADGTVVAWGAGITNAAPSDFWDRGQSMVPAGLTDVVAIATGAFYSLALRADGTALAWGDHYSGPIEIPTDWTNLVAIADNLALKADGTVTEWGGPAAPSDLTNVLAIATGGGHKLALIGNGPSVLHTPVTTPIMTANSFSVALPTQSGRVYRLEYKSSLAEDNWTALPLVAGNGGVRTLTDATATGAQRFYRVRQW